MVQETFLVVAGILIRKLMFAKYPLAQKKGTACYQKTTPKRTADSNEIVIFDQTKLSL